MKKTICLVLLIGSSFSYGMDRNRYLVYKALQDAITAGNQEEVARILKNGSIYPIPRSLAEQFKREDSHYELPLHHAAKIGNESTVRLVIQQCAMHALYEPDIEGKYTALHHAAMSGHTKAVSALLEKMKDINKTAEGKTALDVAASQEIQTLLKNHGALTAEDAKKQRDALFAKRYADSLNY